MSTFDFLPVEFPNLYEDAVKAESAALSDPRTSCFYARRVVELATTWMFANDPSLERVYESNVSSLLAEPSFLNVAGDRNLKLTREIVRLGNRAVHDAAGPSQHDSVAVVSHLFQFCFWFARTYGKTKPPDTLTFDPHSLPAAAVTESASPEQLADLEHRLEVSEKARRSAELAVEGLAEVEAERDRLRAEVAEAKRLAFATPDTHDYSESHTRDFFIDLLLREAGWPFAKGQPVHGKDVEFPVIGMPNPGGIGAVDYVLWADDGLPVALVEAKRTRRSPLAGQQQAVLYANCLEEMFGQRPVIFYSNGFEHWMWDDESYPPHQVQGFYTKDELDLLVWRRKNTFPLSDVAISSTVVERAYQHRAIRRVDERFDVENQRRALLVMATGTGKTRVSVALADQMIRANKVKRVLFLADRRALVKQALNAYKSFLPDATPVNLLEDQDAEGRIFFSTYPTMMNLINAQRDGERRFGVGYFDLIFIDEAHRSIFRKYRAIFDYFDSYLVGLTATPREDVDHDTYALFGLETGVPTDAYPLEQAVSDGFLVPFKTIKVATKFMEEGISYDQLPPEEREQWDELDWPEDEDPPDTVTSAAMMKWLFNEDTVDKVLETLMQDGIKVSGGDRLGKTIIFAANQAHAEFVARRFDANYPRLKGKFARIITYKVEYAQSLIDDFYGKDKNPHLAISVDMLDTGIDVPEVVNLVFFKRVRSKTKFWQMIGRGTRLCEDLFAPGDDKQFFQVFDFCGNFEYFNQNPDLVEGTSGVSINEQRFRRRVEILQVLNGRMTEPGYAEQVAGELRKEVDAINLDNFVVRPHRLAVEKFKANETWDSLADDDLEVLHEEVAALPNELESENIEAKRFDVLLLGVELAWLQGTRNYERLQNQVINIVSMLEDYESIPAVARQMAFIQEVQSVEWWEGVTLAMLEGLRVRLRDLVSLIERRQQERLYANFVDTIVSYEPGGSDGVAPPMDFETFRRKARAFLKERETDAAILKIRHNYPVSKDDVAQLEGILLEAGIGTTTDFERARSEAGSFGLFIRSLVGLNRASAKEAFGAFLDDKRFNANQIHFVDLIIDDLTVNGSVAPDRFYESPFTDIAAQGPQTLFSEEEIGQLIAELEKVRANASVG